MGMVLRSTLWAIAASLSVLSWCPLVVAIGCLMLFMWSEDSSATFNLGFFWTTIEVFVKSALYTLAFLAILLLADQVRPEEFDEETTENRRIAIKGHPVVTLVGYPLWVVRLAISQSIKVVFCT